MALLSSSDDEYITSSSEGDITDDNASSPQASARSSLGGGDEQEQRQNGKLHSHDWYFRYKRFVGDKFIGYESEGPIDEGLFLEMLLDGETIDVGECEFRQGRFAEWMPLAGICELSEFPEKWISEAERRHTENTSLRELFLKFDKDGSCSIDREEMAELMESLQFPTPLNEDEFLKVAGPDGEIDFEELHDYLLRVAPL